MSHPRTVFGAAEGMGGVAKFVRIGPELEFSFVSFAAFPGRRDRTGSW